MPSPTVAGELARRGWAVCRIEGGEDTVLAASAAIGRELGARSPGRHGDLLEMVVPTDADRAHARSLSSRHGLGALPFHVEQSHRPRPCRYVILACLDVGRWPVATTLLDRRTLAFTPDEAAALAGAPLFVRSGRRSFYSTIISPGAAFIRFDEACMEAVDERGRYAMNLMSARIAGVEPTRHEWREGDVLVVDNWRMLHGRDAARGSSGRRLARMMIDG